MKLKLDKQTLLLAVSIVVILFLALFYGQIYFLAPKREASELMEQMVASQETLMETYPPEEVVLEEYKDEYGTTQSFLPERENINEAVLLLEQTAKQENVTLNRVSRIGEPQLVEGLGDSYLKSSYQVEVSSASAANMRNMIESLTNLERVWNISTFHYEKYEDNLYEGSFTFELFYHTLGN